MTEGAANIPARQPIRAPHGTDISCRGWQQEAALRTLINSVDRDVAEAPELLMPCAAGGKVAADWNAFRAITDALVDLASDAMLLVQRGKPAGIFSTGVDSPRTLILDGDPAASWLNIGPQLCLPESYELLGAAKRQYFADDLAGKLIAADGMSFEGAALSLAALTHGAAFLGIDSDSERVKRYVKTGYCDVMVNNLDEALRILKNAVRKREPASVGLSGDPAEIMQQMASRGVVPNLLADVAKVEDGPTRAIEDGARSLQKLGSTLLSAAANSLTTGDGATLCCVALSGEPGDVQRIDRRLLELLAEDESFTRGLRTWQRRVRYQGLPARAIRLGGELRRRLAVAVNQLVAQGESKAPIVIGRLAGAFHTVRADREATAPASERPRLDELLRLTAGATWASIAHDPEDHPRVVAAAVVADGTKQAGARLERVLAQSALP